MNYEQCKHDIQRPQDHFIKIINSLKSSIKQLLHAPYHFWTIYDYFSAVKKIPSVSFFSRKKVPLFHFRAPVTGWMMAFTKLLHSPFITISLWMSRFLFQFHHIVDRCSILWPAFFFLLCHQSNASRTTYNIIILSNILPALVRFSPLFHCINIFQNSYLFVRFFL